MLKSPTLQRLFATSPRLFRSSTSANLRRAARVTCRASCSISSKASDEGERTSSKTKRRRKKKLVEKQELLGPLFPFEGTTNVPVDEEQLPAQNAEPQLTIIDRITTKTRRTYHIRLDDGTSYRLPSVTTILEETQPVSRQFMLRNWAKGLIKEHGKEGFDQIKRDIQNNGTHFHQRLESKLLEASENVPFSIKSQRHLDRRENKAVGGTDDSQLEPSPPSSTTALPAVAMATTASTSQGQLQAENSLERSSIYLQSVEHILEDITDVYALESVVAHIELGYTGTFDCVAKYKGELCLIDWKTSMKPKPLLADCYDFPLQAAAYAGAINHSSFYPFKVFNALIVVAYASGEPGHCHYLSHEDCLQHWHSWNLRLEQYQTQFAGDLSELYII